MESYQQLDPARASGSSIRYTLVLLIALIAPVVLCSAGEASEIKRWFEQQRWEELVQAADATTHRTPDVEYYHGIALARLGRWTAAEAHLLAGLRMAPRDERFLVELGGLAFKQKKLPEATAWLRKAVRANAADAYASDFLGTLYFLQGNLEAALKYWNRRGKPEISEVEIEPGFQTDSVLLDRAFTFAPGSTLLLRDLRATSARLSGLDVFRNEIFRLEARTDGKFGLRFSAIERNGMGSNKWHALLSTLRGLPYRAIQPEYFNLHGQGINITSMLRWDPQKRRINAALSSPFGKDLRYRMRVAADARDERWEITDGSATYGAFGLRRTAVSAGVSSFPSGSWRWSSAGELSYRAYRDVSATMATAPSLHHAGYQLKHSFSLVRDLWRLPEDGIQSSLEVSSETGRIWSQSSGLFQRLQVAVGGRWTPRRTNDDYAVRVKSRAGQIFGRTPFDELFILGLERDNDLWIRAHIGTHDGRKGSAPMGRGYVVFNSEIDKNIYSSGFVRVKLAPFLDVGKITSASSLAVPRRWLWDTGVQAKLSAFGIGFTFTYGKDLRSGNNVFYLTAQH